MRVLVCGGRDYRDRDHLRSVLDVMHKKQRIEWVIHGCAGRKDPHGEIICGADLLAGEWASDRIIPEDPYPAQWEVYGRHAGPIRNQHMLDLSMPDVVLAFPGGRGTADMVRRAKAAGVPVREVG